MVECDTVADNAQFIAQACPTGLGGGVPDTPAAQLHRRNVSVCSTGGVLLVDFESVCY
jgi:hypothetical protein